MLTVNYGNGQWIVKTVKALVKKNKYLSFFSYLWQLSRLVKRRVIYQQKFFREACMNIKNIAVQTFAAAGCLLFLAGCASQAPAPENSDSSVQDINPGERSIITPPSGVQQSGKTDIQEKNI